MSEKYDYEGFIPLDQLLVSPLYLGIINGNKFNTKKLHDRIVDYNKEKVVKPIKLSKDYIFVDGILTLTMAIMLNFPSIPYTRIEENFRFKRETLKSIDEININKVERDYRAFVNKLNISSESNIELMNKQNKKCKLCDRQITFDMVRPSGYRLAIPVSLFFDSGEEKRALLCSKCIHKLKQS